jgi:hypothetical protein
MLSFLLVARPQLAVWTWDDEPLLDGIFCRVGISVSDEKHKRFTAHHHSAAGDGAPKLPLRSAQRYC